MKNVMNMDRDEFRQALADHTTPQAIYDNAKYPYRFMSDLFKQNCIDSLLREWAFQWSSEQLDLDYNEIYNKWLGEFCLN
jgi:hypothetical protein